MATAFDAEILADPVGFTAGILGHDIWRIPAQILESVAKNRRTAVKSCHASGRSMRRSTRTGSAGRRSQYRPLTRRTWPASA